jgi:hypothetical protein
MSEPYEIKKAKIDSLVVNFTNLGYKSSNRIGQTELLQFLNKRTSYGLFDTTLAEKLFQILNLDHMSTMFVEDFINGFLQFEEDIRRNAEIFNVKLNQEQEIYNKLVEQCRRYKSEKLNAEGLCENAKVYGEITDIDVKKKLEGIKEIIIKVVYNDKSEELHFKIGDINSSEMLNKSFGFKPTSRKDHFEFIMKGVNDRNQVFDIGSKVFPLTEINSYEEYIVQIVVPEIDNEEEIAAYIHAKIVLYWSDYKFYERQKRKAESRLKKLTSAANKANEYLKLVREIYGDLTKKKPDLIVDFNNEKLMQRKGGKLNVNFNNQKEADAPGGNYVVEFNNLREVQKTVEPMRLEFNNSKEVIKKTIKQETITKKVQSEQAESKLSQASQSKTAQQIAQEQSPFIKKIEEEQKVEYLPPKEANYSYMQQIQTETNIVQNGGQEQNLNDYLQQASTNGVAMTTFGQNQYGGQGGMALAETIGYGVNDTMGGVQAYGTGGYEYIDQNPGNELRNSEVVKQTEFRTSINRAMFNESTNKTLFSEKTLPVKVLGAKINKPIIDSNVRTLPVIFGRKSITYDNNGQSNYENNNFYQGGQGYGNYM